jgi:ABC-type cobalamin/Fe3+-siderophores transport system ATPase subunit
MLTEVTLKFSEHEDLSLPTNGITIFVGPNNSGKSLVLKEIEEAFISNPFPQNTRILKDFEIRWLSNAEIDIEIAKHPQSEFTGIPVGHIQIGRINPNGGREATNLHIDSLKQIGAQKQNKSWWVSQFARWGLLRLDGRSRFNLTNDQAGGDLLSPPQNVLSHLFQDQRSRSRVKELIKDAFGLVFSIDPTNLGQLRIRLSREGSLEDEQSLNEKARAYYRKAIHIKDASDGVQAFTGIVTAVISGEYHTILIDEPEAFLHPPLARKLGTSLARLAMERGGALLASTHSADFLMGCIQATKDVRVVRLEYSGEKSRGRMVDPVELENLFRSPLMRSANAISGLFYDGVVVAESDNDRSFYSEIYHRLAALDSDYPSILFINAQNKQTIKNIIAPLRKFGVPAAAVPDIDILKDGGRTWLEWLDAAHIPELLHTGFSAQRASIKNYFETAEIDMKAHGGVNALPLAERQAAEHLFSTLADYGVFAVQRGEVENWLPSLDVPGKKTDWTVAMLERLGSDPADDKYVRPANDDVWEFVRGIVKWVRNGSRKGTS